MSQLKKTIFNITVIDIYNIYCNSSGPHNQYLQKQIKHKLFPIQSEHMETAMQMECDSGQAAAMCAVVRRWPLRKGSYVGSLVYGAAMLRGGEAFRGLWPHGS